MMHFTKKRPRDRSPTRRHGGPALILSVIALLCMAASVHANTIVVELVSVTPSGSNFDWKYRLSLTNNSSMFKGLSTGDTIAPDFAEIFDFGPTIALPTFTPSAAAILLLPSFAGTNFVVDLPSQDAAAEIALFGVASSEQAADQTDDNIRLKYDNGANFVYQIPGFGIPAIVLGDLIATSKYGNARFDTYISTDTQPTGVSGKHSDPIQVPVVPTPQTVWGGLALFSVMGLVKARRIVGV